MDSAFLGSPVTGGRQQRDEVGHTSDVYIRFRRHMDSSALAQIIAAKVVADTTSWVALVGLFGVFVGAVVTVLGNLLLHWMQGRRRTELDRKRKVLLERMLRDDRFPERWRQLDTLARIIGASAEGTKVLLIELGARGSEKNDGMWGLLEYHPLEQSER
jgi:hypothetical protein